MTASVELTLESLQFQIAERDQKIVELFAQLSDHQTQNFQLQEQNLRLQEHLAWFQKQFFGKKSERVVEANPDQLQFEGFETPAQQPSETEKIPAHERKKRTSTGKDAIQIPNDLPVEIVVVDVPVEEQVCKETGAPLKKIGEEITHKLVYRPGSYVMKRIIRPKYAHPHQEERGITIASMPDSILPKCRADDSLLAEIVTRKFVDHLPLYRLEEGFLRDQIFIHRRVLSQWVVSIGITLKPLYDVMKKRILEEDRLHIDETPVDLLDSPKISQGYMWVLVGGVGADPPYRFYEFHEDRKHNHVEEMLGSYAGIIHSDKYGAYETFVRKHGNVWCPCFAHIRRKFYEAEVGDRPLRAWVLEQIQQLFAIEEIAWTLSPQERLHLRQSQSIPILDALIDRVKKRLIEGNILPKSKFKEALGYFFSLIPHLKNYTQHASARLDNNTAERAIRPLAIGRKNWLFLGSEKSGLATAVLLSLVQSCRAIGVNPRLYLEDIFRRFHGHTANRLYELLPDEWQKRQSQSSKLN